MRWRSTMGRPYPPEFRRQMVELVRSGRTADDLQREFRVSRESIRLWVAQAEREESDREALKPDERAEFERLRRENRQLRLERDILSKAAAWFARVMAAAGIAGVSRRKFVTTTVKRGGRPASDLVDRDFTAEKPDLLWVADITYVPTWAGFLYLAVVLDACSRRIVGWSMATTLATSLVLDALEMALTTRRPNGVIHHSDQGSQYTSVEFGRRCREAGVRPSMGSVG